MVSGTTALQEESFIFADLNETSRPKEGEADLVVAEPDRDAESIHEAMLSTVRHDERAVRRQRGDPPA